MTVRATEVFKRSWAATWRISLFLFLWGALLAPSVLILQADADSSPGLGAPTMLILEVLGAIAVMLAAGIMLRLADRRSLVSLGFDWRRAGVDIAIGLGLGGAMMALAVGLLAASGWAQLVSAEAFSWRLLGLMAAIVFFNSVTQEVLVRGYILQTIEAQFRAGVAVFASSLIFAALHAGMLVEGGMVPALNLLLAGVLLGLAYTATRQLWLPIALHFAWNFVQGPVLGIAVSGKVLDGGWRFVEIEGPELLAGGAFGVEGGLVATMVTLGATGVLWVFRHRLAPRESGAST